MAKPLVVGNWKTGVTGKWGYSSTRAIATDSILASEIIAAAANISKKVDLVICPPYTSLTTVKECIADTDIHLGAQDVANSPNRIDGKPVTGEVPFFMLENLASHVIVGHSERQKHCREDHLTVADKFALLCNSTSLIPIVCVSESGDTFGNVEKAKHQIVERLLELLKVANLSKQTKSTFAIAYEPSWAIGGDSPADVDYVQAVTDEIAKTLRNEVGNPHNLPILYGGSVSVDSVGSLAELPNVGGFLIGRASLIADQFCKIADITLQKHIRKS